MIATIIIIAMFAVGLGFSIAKHGEEKVRKYSMWQQLLKTIVWFTLFYFAGLFDKFFD